MHPCRYLTDDYLGRTSGTPYQQEPDLRYFEYGHLSTEEQTVRRPFHELAYHMFNTLPRNLDRRRAINNLLKAMWAAERAVGNPPSH